MNSWRESVLAEERAPKPLDRSLFWSFQNEETYDGVAMPYQGPTVGRKSSDSIN